MIHYIACNCNYDLCASQRNGDYKKWKFFDMCLFNAIQKLSTHETGKYPVYSGLNGVKMDKKIVTNGYFVTYVSTSWRREVSEIFTGGDKGMIIQFDEEYRNHETVKCCDVSWISKFPDECEVLFARSFVMKAPSGSANGCHYYTSTENNFTCVVLDEIDGKQIVSLKRSNW